MIKKKKLIWLLVPFILLVSFLIGTGFKKKDMTEIHSIRVEGTVANKKELTLGIETIQNNLKAAAKKDLNTYLDTLVTSAKPATKKEMSQFFKDYSLKHRILSILVLDQQKTRMLLQVSQETTVAQEQPQKEAYRNHISEANHTLVLEDGLWKISETVMTNTEFID